MKLALIILGFVAIVKASPRGVVARDGVVAIQAQNVLKNLFGTKCNGPICTGGCCPESDYVCCEGGHFCASSSEECPQFPQVKKKLELTRDECDGTMCPGGCCSGVHDWFCCQDGVYCVISPEYCVRRGYYTGGY